MNLTAVAAASPWAEVPRVGVLPYSPQKGQRLSTTNVTACFLPFRRH
jgi:predicted small integral membrane protein